MSKDLEDIKIMWEDAKEVATERMAKLCCPMCCRIDTMSKEHGLSFLR